MVGGWLFGDDFVVCFFYGNIEVDEFMFFVFNIYVVELFGDCYWWEIGVLQVCYCFLDKVNIFVEIMFMDGFWVENILVYYVILLFYELVFYKVDLEVDFDFGFWILFVYCNEIDVGLVFGLFSVELIVYWVQNFFKIGIDNIICLLVEYCEGDVGFFF